MTEEQAHRFYRFTSEQLWTHQKECVLCKYGHSCTEWDRLLGIKREFAFRLQNTQRKERGLYD